ncbi:MAG TPA: hypothetical protein VNQ77_16750 [Frankiaceae bacterium]|nr:hypothetical protein [Frankiaceae bacterium]
MTDPSNDANAGGYWRSQDTSTPVGSQAYADVTAVEFRTMRTTRVVRGKRTTAVTGFTVTMRLSAPPAPPGGSVGVYRVLAQGPGCLFGVDYYTREVAGQAGAAIQEWCVGSSIRRIALKPPSVKGAAITWTVPLAALPRNTKAVAGTTLTDLHFQVLVRPHDTLCAGAPGTPAEEREPCAVVLDDTLDRGGTYTIR